MLVYRIEKDGLGPYTHPSTTLSYSAARGGTYGWCTSTHNDPTHPAIHHELSFEDVPYDRNLLYCGFSSVHSLVTWFDDAEIRNLHDMRFKLVVLDVDPQFVFKGKLQLCFVKHMASVVREINLFENKESLMQRVQSLVGTGCLGCSGTSEPTPRRLSRYQLLGACQEFLAQLVSLKMVR